MSTSTKTSSGAGTMIVAVGLAVIGLVALNNLPRGKDDDGPKRKVLLSATWTPSPREPGVEIRTTAESVVDSVQTVAPFNQPHMVTAGTRVEIRVKLRGSWPAFIGCSIVVDGVEAVTEFNRNAGADDSVTCWTVV